MFSAVCYHQYHLVILAESSSHSMISFSAKCIFYVSGAPKLHEINGKHSWVQVPLRADGPVQTHTNMLKSALLPLRLDEY